MGMLLQAGLRGDLVAFLGRFALNQQGSTAIEYGLIASAIAVSISTLMISISDSVTGMFDRVLGVFTS